jgi:acetyl esterase/lipase
MEGRAPAAPQRAGPLSLSLSLSLVPAPSIFGRAQRWRRSSTPSSPVVRALPPAACQVKSRSTLAPRLARAAALFHNRQVAARLHEAGEHVELALTCEAAALALELHVSRR